MNRAQVAKMPLAWCSQVHHYGFSSRRPGSNPGASTSSRLMPRVSRFPSKNADARTVNVKHRSTLERPWLPSETAPAFTLRATDKREVSLSEFSGQTIVMVFYPGAFTGVCDKELCAFRDSMDALNKADAVVLGISVDSPWANAEFAQYNLEFELLSTSTGRPFTPTTLPSWDWVESTDT